MPYAELYYDEKTGRYSLPERLVHIPFKKYLDWMFNRRGRLADTKIVNSPEAIKMTNQLVEDLDSLKALVNRVTDAGDPKKTERLLKEYEHFFRTVGACVSWYTDAKPLCDDILKKEKAIFSKINKISDVIDNWPEFNDALELLKKFENLVFRFSAYNAQVSSAIRRLDGMAMGLAENWWDRLLEQNIGLQQELEFSRNKHVDAHMFCWRVYKMSDEVYEHYKKWDGIYDDCVAIIEAMNEDGCVMRDVAKWVGKLG